MTLLDSDIIAISREHGVQPEATKAVIVVETPAPHVGDYQPGKPLILFERHKFYALSGALKVSKAAPDLAQRKAGGYCKGATWQQRQACEHVKLARARALFDERANEAALKSVSMGLFQIMGFNHALLGHKSVTAMWERYLVVDDHLDLEDFFRFIANAGLLQKLRALDWDGFARGYNGPLYAKNRYDSKLRDNHTLFRRQGLLAAAPAVVHPSDTGFPDFSQSYAA